MTLLRMSEADLPRLAHMMTGYLAEVAPEGNFDTEMLARKHLTQAKRHAFWIGETVHQGFALLFEEDGIFEMAEFYIIPDHRRGGLGQRAAHAVLGQFPGHWRLGVVKTPEGPRHFWQRCLATCPGLVDLRQHAPLTEHQIASYTFRMEGTR